MASAWPRAILQEEAHVQGHDYLHRYDTTDVTLAIQHRSVHMTKIADLDVLLEESIRSPLRRTNGCRIGPSCGRRQ